MHRCFGLPRQSLLLADPGLGTFTELSAATCFAMTSLAAIRSSAWPIAARMAFCIINVSVKSAYSRAETASNASSSLRKCLNSSVRFRTRWPDGAMARRYASVHRAVVEGHGQGTCMQWLAWALKAVGRCAPSTMCVCMFTPVSMTIGSGCHRVRVLHCARFGRSEGFPKTPTNMPDRLARFVEFQIACEPDPTRALKSYRPQKPDGWRAHAPALFHSKRRFRPRTAPCGAVCANARAGSVPMYGGGANARAGSVPGV